MYFFFLSEMTHCTDQRYYSICQQSTFNSILILINSMEKQILLHSFLKWGETVQVCMIKPLFELVNTDLLLLPRSLSSSVQEIMFKEGPSEGKKH